MNLKDRIKNYFKNKIEPLYLYRYPLFISYPRSGAHWINSIMEVYFNRPRLRKARETFLDRKRRDWMWMHDHDLYLKIIDNIERKKPKENKILFLFRNPLDTIYSHVNAANKIFKVYGHIYGKELKNKETAFSEENILKFTNHWIKFHEKYLKEHKGIKITYVKYSNFVDPKKRSKEFAKICRHFDKPFFEKRLEQIWKKYGKRDLDPNKKMGREQYKKEKEEFMKKHKKEIENKTKETYKKLLKKID